MGWCAWNWYCTLHSMMGFRPSGPRPHRSRWIETKLRSRFSIENTCYCVICCHRKRLGAARVPHGIGPIILILFFWFGVQLFFQCLHVRLSTVRQYCKYDARWKDGSLGRVRTRSEVRTRIIILRQDFRVGIGIFDCAACDGGAVQIAEYGMFFAPRQTGTNVLTTRVKEEQ